MSPVKRKINLGMARFSGLYVWIIFIIIFAIWVPKYFLTMATASSIASAQVVTGVMAFAVMIPLIAGVFDLSVGSTAIMGSIFSVSFQTQYHMNMWLSIILTILIGLVIGLVNGFVVVKLHVNSFIATLGMGSIVVALVTWECGGLQPLLPTSTTWGNLTQAFFGGGFQVGIFYLVAFAFLLWWVLSFTPAGRYLFAIGSNSDAARLSGVSVDFWIWSSLVCSGFLAGFAGVLFSSQTGPSLSFGSGLLLPAFAAVFLGSTQLTPGRFNVWGTLLAIFVLATGVQGLQFVVQAPWLDGLFNGVALIAAVAFAVSRQRSEGRRKEIEQNLDVGSESTAALDEIPSTEFHDAVSHGHGENEE
jgi:ribose transport system permease protein